MSSESESTQQAESSSEYTPSNDQTKTKQKTASKTKTQTKTKTKQTKSIEDDQEMQQVVEEHQLQKIDELAQKGIAAADITRLKESGLQTLQALDMATHKQLSQIKGISEQKIDKLKQAVKELQNINSFITAQVCLQNRANLYRISTGSKELDQLLGGGIETKQICEVFGEFRCGKSQLCHTMAVTAQHPRYHGSCVSDWFKVIYIDTESTFRPERIQQIASRFGADEKTILQNILVSRVYNHEQQMAVLSALPQILVQNKVSLIVIDSLTALFRADFQGRGELAERQQKLMQHLSQLIKLADEYNLLVFVTNQVQAMVDGSAMFQSDPKKPIGGHILAHASTTRLSLRKGRGETRICKVYDSPNLPEAEATFAITQGGIDDANE